MDPVTGHSTLNANQIGLPRSSVDLIDAAVEDTNIAAPQPVGAFSSSIAVKPTSGNSTDLNKIIGNSLLSVKTFLASIARMLSFKGSIKLICLNSWKQGRPSLKEDTPSTVICNYIPDLTMKVI